MSEYCGKGDSEDAKNDERQINVPQEEIRKNTSLNPMQPAVGMNPRDNVDTTRNPDRKERLGQEEVALSK